MVLTGKGFVAKHRTSNMFGFHIFRDHYITG